MNIHNTTQISHAKINYALKDSNSDTPIPKILMLAILATCVSSSSTKNAMLTLKKRNTIHVFTHRLALIFQLIFGSVHSRSKSASKSSLYSPPWIAWKPDFFCTLFHNV
ncbi:hypothetical protein H5410_056253 [Solanum commersonii]|uniref:Uncharacterized protein n=1 Tax=Solanum commersonii TaxID=4109 RepID=A0A9J5WLL3_SOLCO|nr:hypothetical protein H5410_056253 [Solanum commersonii]